jgi:peptidoglycan hydrolase-like protein with peptidoglycan-binding domain
LWFCVLGSCGGAGSLDAGRLLRPEPRKALALASTATCGQEENMLQRGSSGKEVKKMQEALKRAGFSPGPIDGIFGPKTEAAVRKFQEYAKVKVDGIVGPKTMGALDKVVREAKKIKKVKPPATGYKNPYDK